MTWFGCAMPGLQKKSSKSQSLGITEPPDFYTQIFALFTSLCWEYRYNFVWNINLFNIQYVFPLSPPHLFETYVFLLTPQSPYTINLCPFKFKIWFLSGISLRLYFCHQTGKDIFQPLWSASALRLQSQLIVVETQTFNPEVLGSNSGRSGNFLPNFCVCGY